MGKSKKKEPIIKDVGHLKDVYNRRFRRACKRIDHNEETVYPNSRELTNDYDVSDWKMDARDCADKEKIKKFKRK